MVDEGKGKVPGPIPQNRGRDLEGTSYPLRLPAAMPNSRDGLTPRNIQTLPHLKISRLFFCFSSSVFEGRKKAGDKSFQLRVLPVLRKGKVPKPFWSCRTRC